MSQNDDLRAAYDAGMNELSSTKHRGIANMVARSPRVKVKHLENILHNHTGNDSSAGYNSAQRLIEWGYGKKHADTLKKHFPELYYRDAATDPVELQNAHSAYSGKLDTAISLNPHTPTKLLDKIAATTTSSIAAMNVVEHQNVSKEALKYLGSNAFRNQSVVIDATNKL